MSDLGRIDSFWRDVPRPFMEQLLRSLFDAYRIADDHCHEFAHSERANLRPFYRRALVESHIRDVANLFGEEVQANAVRHDDKGFWFHTRVVCNDAVALTQNTVPFPDAVVRNSCFRDRYSQSQNQRYLIPELEPERMPVSTLLYGILLHGRSKESPIFPGFAQIRFPKPRLAGYFEQRIDLFSEFPCVVEEKTTGFPGDFSTVDELIIEPVLLDEVDIRSRRSV